MIYFSDPKGKCKDIESDEESDSEAEPSSWSRGKLNYKGNDFYQEKLRKVYKKRVELRLAESLQQQEHDSTNSLSQERPLVKDDDVCVHVIGLPGSLTAEETFSAVFGVFQEPNVWKVPGTLFEIFEGRGLLYHRDQLVPIQSPLKGLSINYHGELRISSDRMEIITHGQEYDQYKANLRVALDKAISAIPNLAALIMRSMLSDFGNKNILKPKSKQYAAEYKAAFEAACGEQNQAVYPFARRAAEADLIRELGFFPWPLDDWQMQILEDAGAYLPIKEYAQNCLLAADECLVSDFPGYDCLNCCVRQMIPELEHDVSVRQYHHSKPRALYQAGHILLAQPETCKRCAAGSKCSCWVGPALVRIMREYDQNLDLETIFYVYNKERKLADERERISNQSHVDNIVLERDSDHVHATTNSAETGTTNGPSTPSSSGNDLHDEAKAPEAREVRASTGFVLRTQYESLTRVII